MKEGWNIKKALGAIQKHLMLFLLSGSINLFAQAMIDSYPMSTLYTRSTDYALVANGKTIDVIKSDDYDYAHFSMGTGSCNIQLISLGKTSIPAYSISPKKLNIQAGTSGNTLNFTIKNDEYLIIWVKDKRKLIIAADPLETDVPAASGAGIFNITNAPYNADKTGATLMTTAIQNAVDAASAYGTANGKSGIVYVPAGIFKMGNLKLKSNVNLYLSKGAVLRFSDNPGDYTTFYRKNSLGLDGTWWIYTENNANNIKLYGRGTIDGNGKYMQKTAKYVNHILIPLNCSNFTLDGLIIRSSAMWGFVVARSNNVLIKNYKHFNAQSIAENDCIDVCESQNVVVQHAIATAHDDPFSTKTWGGVELCKNWYGTVEQNRNITFDDCISWTGCVGFKVGQGMLQLQENITFKNGVIYDCARGLAIEHKWGANEGRNITFENIDIERVGNTCEGPQWLQLFIKSGDGLGGGAVSNVLLRNITVRDKGTRASQLRGHSASSAFRGVTFENIYMQGNTRPAASLNEMNITETNGFVSDIKILPAQTPSSKIQAEYYNDYLGVTRAACDDNEKGSMVVTNNGDWMRFINLDFGSSTSNVDVRYASVSTGTIELRIGNFDGTLVGTLAVTNTGGLQTYQTKRVAIQPVSGTHNLYLVCRKSDAEILAHVNWLELDKIPGYATVYSDCNFAGQAISLGAADYTQSMLLAKGIADNTISSIKIVPGCLAIGWENNNFQGAAWTSTKTDTCLVDNAFNDRISSLKVRINSANINNGTYALKNRYSGLYMDVAGNVSTDNASIDQWVKNNQLNQQFTFAALGSGVYKITAVNSGKSLEVAASSSAEGARIVQNVYSGKSSQQFFVQSTGDGYYRLIAKHSNKLIQAKELSKVNGAMLEQWSQGVQLSGQWELVPVAGALAKDADLEEDNTLAGADSKSIELYPSPAENMLNITSGKNIMGAELKIMDLMGNERLVIPSLNSNDIDVSSLHPGIYIVTLVQNGWKVNQRFMKQ